LALVVRSTIKPPHLSHCQDSLLYNTITSSFSCTSLKAGRTFRLSDDLMAGMSMLEFGVPHLLTNYSVRNWNTMFGMSLDKCNQLHLEYVPNVKPLYLLWTLYYLRNYPTDSAGALWANVTAVTWRKHIRVVLELLPRQLPQLRIHRRWLDWQTLNPSSIVDGADVPILEPKNAPFYFRQRFCSPKKGCPCLRYMIMVHFHTGEIVWCSAAYPGGASEPKIIIEEIAFLLEEGERMLGDQLFRKYPRYFIVHERGNKSLRERTLNSGRAKVEHKIERIKNFAICKIQYRSYDYEHHELCFHLCCQLVNFIYHQ